MKSNILKLTGISFPVFCLKHKPFKLEYSSSSIYCYIHEDSNRATLDNKDIPGDYFHRLFSMKHRVTFDYTCNSIQDIIYSRTQWGIDCNGKIHDFSKRYIVPWESRRIKRIHKNLIWLDKISYPFKINTNEELPITTETYATIVYVNNEWYIKEFTLDKCITKQRITV